MPDEDQAQHSEDQAQHSETVEEQEVAGVQHRPEVNQRRHEPVAGRSHQADKERAGQAGQAAPAKPEHPRAAPGDAVRDMMGGQPPQGDAPGAPATQIAAADEEDGEGTRVRRVANAVPGKPDGEVDTRFGSTGT